MCTSSGISHVVRRDSVTGWILAALALVLIGGTGPAVAQWTPQSPLPTFLDVRGVGAPSSQHVFLATEDDSFDDGGALWESTDAGLTWVQRAVPFSLGSPLNGLYFRDSLNGWAFGNDNYRTTDGGATWQELPFLGSTYFMEFYTPTFGYASTNGDAWVSLDGGLTWEIVPSGMFAFDFADDLTGLGVAADGLRLTADGGASFVPVLTGEGDAVTFLSGSRAVAIVDDAFVRSTDGGATWATGPGAEGRTRLTAISANDVLAWGRTGSFPEYDDRLLQSTDGGATWTDVGEVMGDDETLAVTRVDLHTAVGADRAGNMYLSTDAGASWAQTFTSPGPWPSFLGSAVPSFVDDQEGYFGYGPGFVIGTTDGGASWEQLSSGSGTTLNDLDRFPNGDLIAVGDGGTVLRSSGGSIPWRLGEPPTAADLEAVQVLGAGAVVAVDSQARLHRSTDAGVTWTAAASTPTSLSGRDLHFTTLTDGWVIGSGFAAGALFRTTDGGGSWTGVPDFQGTYVAVDFEGSSGWAANAGGRFYRTIDGGATWIQEELPGSSLSIRDMEFWDVSLGYAVGFFGYAARTEDGGLTWDILPTPDTGVVFTDIHLLGPNELWLSTSDNEAYHSATGGYSWSVLDTGATGFGYSSIVGVPGGDAWTAGWNGAIDRFTGPPPPPVNQPPAAGFNWQSVGLTATFTDLSEDVDGSIVSWVWDFGDSTQSTQQNPTHAFATADTYIVRLTVTDDDGDTGSTVRFIVVQPGPGGTFGDFTEVTPLDPLFVTPQDEDFWVATTAPADFDGDGDLDMAVFGYYVVYGSSVEERLVLVRNEGQLTPTEWEFSYVDVELDGLASGASDLAWADADGDGDQDLALGTYGETVIYRNDGGTLTLTDTVLPGYYEDNSQAFGFDLQSMSWADYDNDGDQDLLVPSVFDDSTFVWHTKLCRNDGPSGTGGYVFTEVPAGLAGTSHAQSEWADMDGDQDLDLLLVNLAPLTDDGFIHVYRNDGGGVFTGEAVLGSLSVEHGEAQWGDYDEDGDLDILVIGNIRETDGTYTNAFRIYRNDDGSYSPVAVIPCIPCEGWFDLTAAAWADYDSDGDIDILLTGTYNSGSQIEGRARILLNDGGVFTDSGNDLPAPRASGTRGGTFSWLDLDEDGDLDYFIAGEYFVPGGNGLIEAQMHAYRNDAESLNQAPSMPSDLSATILGGGAGRAGGVLFSWNAATDDLTSAMGLTYDLDVFREGVPVATPARLPQPGNVKGITAWALQGLADGAYSWTLRAVDSAYNGGPAASGAFVVGDAVGVDPIAGLPRTFEFQRNFPNPFRGETTFRFALPERVEVGLTVYDAAGRRVAQLLDEPREAGIHQVKWNARGVASGVYFVRLDAGSFRQTQRVLLLK